MGVRPRQALAHHTPKPCVSPPSSSLYSPAPLGFLHKRRALTSNQLSASALGSTSVSTATPAAPIHRWLLQWTWDSPTVQATYLREALADSALVLEKPTAVLTTTIPASTAAATPAMGSSPTPPTAQPRARPTHCAASPGTASSKQVELRGQLLEVSRRAAPQELRRTAPPPFLSVALPLTLGLRQPLSEPSVSPIASG